MHFPSSCVGVPVPAVAIADQLSFLAGIRRLVDYRSLDVCRKTESQQKSVKVLGHAGCGGLKSSHRLALLCLSFIWEASSALRAISGEWWVFKPYERVLDPLLMLCLITRAQVCVHKHKPALIIFVVILPSI